jgi:hypothetical protein
MLQEECQDEKELAMADQFFKTFIYNYIENEKLRAVMPTFVKSVG